MRENVPARFRMSGNAEIVDNLGVVAGGGVYIKGVMETTFSPGSTCTRGQIVGEPHKKA